MNDNRCSVSAVKRAYMGSILYRQGATVFVCPPDAEIGTLSDGDVAMTPYVPKTDPKE